MLHFLLISRVQPTANSKSTMRLNNFNCTCECDCDQTVMQLKTVCGAISLVQQEIGF